MKRQYRYVALAVILLAALIFLLVKAQSHKRFRVNPAFREYVSAFTTGVVSIESSIKIRLNHDYADSSQFMQAIETELFDFSPNVKGTAYWIDKRTIEFKPDKPLKRNQEYRVKFYLKELIKVPDSLSVFEFRFHTMRQAMEVSVENIKNIDENHPRTVCITGIIKTADVADLKKVKSTLTASQKNRDLPVTVSPMGDGCTFTFRVDSVERTDKQGTVKLKWNGKAIGASAFDMKLIEIPPVGVFTLTNVTTIKEPEQYVVLTFSDLLQPDQDLTGLIKFGNQENFKTSITDNQIKIYPGEFLTGSLMITLESSIKNIQSKTLGKRYQSNVDFDEIKPAIRIKNDGNILPSSNGMLLPFEAVNLKAVEVKVYKIFENNILQFLQINELDGSSQMARVGRKILSKTISLSGLSANYTQPNQWNTYTLDLTDLIKAEPGALYRVSLSFKKEHSIYPCEGQDNKEDDKGLVPWKQEEEDLESESGWGYYYDEEDYYYDYEDYDWRQRENPCNSSYYYYNNCTVSKNILASDIGLLAKRGSDGKLQVFATNLITSKPLSGCKIEIYDYQLQLLGTSNTNNDGNASFDLKRKPWCVIARNENHRNYLKLNDGNALSMSMFDVTGGISIKKGIKGFLYGERGVWRPGDTLFLTFILEDKLDKIPDIVPVVLEITNPRGQLVKQMVKTSSVNGFYSYVVPTESDYPTGTYTARVKVGGAVFTKYLKIETIKPNRLKIKLDFHTEKITANADLTGDLEVVWLHGGIARNLKADVEATVNPSKTEFKGYKDYIFDDPAKRFKGETYTIFKGKLDETGKAKIKPDLEIGTNAPGILKAWFRTRVFEEGGDFSTDGFSVLYYPYNSYVGIKVPKGQGWGDMLYTNQTHKIELANVNANGAPISGSKLRIDLYKLDWRWWWDYSSDRLVNYVNSSYNLPVLSKEVFTSQGKAVFDLKINEADWGTYFIRVTDLASGHSTGKRIYVDYPFWNENKSDALGKATLLFFTSEKESYKVNEKAKINIPSGKGGMALISIENGSRIIDYKWIETSENKTEYSFTITPEMAPNIYVYVTLLQPHSQTINDLPIRMYGVIPLKVEDPSTHLKPVIQMAETIRPEVNVPITVKEETGKPMTFTLAVVDEGLLDLTKFETPDPWKAFYEREALGVTTWDLYDQVIGAYGATIERLLSIGGGDEGEITSDKGKKNASRFKPVVRFYGPFALPKGGSKTLTLNITNYIGSVRVMAIAGQNGAYGCAEKTVAVKKPLMTLATLPRVLSPGEEVKLPVNVFAMDKNIKTVAVKVQTNSLLQTEGSGQKTISFKQPGDQLVNFNLKVKKAIGIGKVMVRVSSGSEITSQTIEIDVRNPNPPVTDVIEKVIQPGQSWISDFTPPGISPTNSAILEISSIPPINLEKRLRYLISYPYGCIEQTTSSVFPQLYLSQLLDLSEQQKTSIDNNIKAGIKQLSKFQNSSGGLSYWPGETGADDWGTSYAGHFMIEASEKGYNLPSGFLDRWKRYQKLACQRWNPESGYTYSDLLQAYRLMTLALAKAPELGAMNRLKESKNLTTTAKWYLAYAYQLAGQNDAALKLIETAPTRVEKYSEMYYSYGSDIRDKAIIAMTLQEFDMKVKSAALIIEISKALSANDWMSTQSTAYCLMAVSKYYQKNNVSKEIQYTYQLNDEAPTSVKSIKAITQKDLNIKGSEAKGQIKVSNNGKGILYARLLLRGQPAEGDKTAAQNDLKISVNYRTLAGKSLNVTKIPQGTDFIAEVTVTNPGIRGYYHNLALNQIFPSGWEIHNSRLADNQDRDIGGNVPTYRDIRDDRVYTFFHLAPNTSKTFNILLNASYIGRYYLPTITCEAMYDHSIHARIPGFWVEVVQDTSVD